MSGPGAIGEVVITREVTATCLHGGGTAEQRGSVSAGLIEYRVRRAYHEDGPLEVPLVDVAAAEAQLQRKARDVVDYWRAEHLGNTAGDIARVSLGVLP